MSATWATFEKPQVSSLSCLLLIINRTINRFLAVVGMCWCHEVSLKLWLRPQVEAQFQRHVLVPQCRRIAVGLLGYDPPIFRVPRFERDIMK